MGGGQGNSLPQPSLLSKDVAALLQVDINGRVPVAASLAPRVDTSLPMQPSGNHFCLRMGTKFQGGQTHVCRAGNNQRSSNETFLSTEEAGLIELTNLEMHERFLCRLTVSSLNLLRVISEQEGVPIERLNAGILCDWFQKDKAKREKDIESATLKW